MSSTWQGGIAAGSTDVTVPVVLRQTSDDTGKTGVAHTSVTASYWRQGATVQAISVSALGSLDAAHSNGGWYEVDSGNRPGEYRFDILDAAFATGADWVEIAVKVAACYVVYERIAICTPVADVILDEARADHDEAGSVGEALLNVQAKAANLRVLKRDTNVVEYHKDGATLESRDLRFKLAPDDSTDPDEVVMVPSTS